MLKLSFYCFPEKGFIDPRDHINICKDFGKLKGFTLKKFGLRTATDMLYGSYFSHTAGLQITAGQRTMSGQK